MRYKTQDPPGAQNIAEYLSMELRRVEAALAVPVVAQQSSASYSLTPVMSSPPAGMRRVRNLYINRDGELFVEYG